jgi:hypothetical protein
MDPHRHFALPTWQDKNNTAPIGRLKAVRRRGGVFVRVSPFQAGLSALSLRKD